MIAGMATRSILSNFAKPLTLIAFTALVGCAGEVSPGAPGPGGSVDLGIPWFDSGAPPNSDPWAPCVTQKTCCDDPSDIECTGDPDSNPTCTCIKLWDCNVNPGKCQQDERVPPGGGAWNCTWSESAYVCEGGIPGKEPPGGNANWNCKEVNGKWVCQLAWPPNPSNKPGGGSKWNCVVQNGKIVCERKPDKETDCTDKKDNDGDGKTDCDDPDCPCPPPVTHESDCNDGKDNDGDGKIDCNDPDCNCPPPPTHETDCKDGKDNDGDGKIDCKDPDCNCPPPITKEGNCADGIDNDKDGKVDCADPDCNCPPPPPPVCPPGKECCDGKDNNGDGKIDEGNVCAGVQEPCPPGAFQACDCYCGVHRKCAPNGTWGPCKVDGNNTCQLAQVTSHSQCILGFCDYGKCVFGFAAGQCKHHTDCPQPLVCDLGKCVPDNYFPCP
jgi:hypothetical protein